MVLSFSKYRNKKRLDTGRQVCMRFIELRVVGVSGDYGAKGENVGRGEGESQELEK